MTVNWHDRSVAPERLWGRVYGAMVQDLRNLGAWLPTASQAVAWFRKRRSAVFESVESGAGVVGARVSADASDELPGLRLRVHRPEAYQEGREVGANPPNGYVDVAMNHRIDTRIPI